MKLTGIIENTFGGRFIFRGYATIGNLIKYSYANSSYQRPVDKKRIEQIVDYLRNDKFRFFTELLFGLELKDTKSIAYLNQSTIPGGILLEDKIKLVKSKFTFQVSIGENPVTKVISLEFNENSTRLTRIDGNHRLSAVEEILRLDDDELKQSLSNLIVPFSILIQQKGAESEKYESAIFYTINAKSKPLTEEENLKSLLKENLFSTEELKSILGNDMPIDAMRAVMDKQSVNMLPALGETFAECYYTCVYTVFKLLTKYNIEADTLLVLSAFKTVELEYKRNSELQTSSSNVDLICAYIFYSCKGDYEYEAFSKWVFANKIYRLQEIQLSTIISIFDEMMRTQVKVFVAMPFYSQEIIRSTNEIYSRVISKIRTNYKVDISMSGAIMTYEGSTINIVNDVLNKIELCDICFCDISGNNANVTYEMGWARALKKHVVILKEESAEGPKSDYLLDYYATFKKDAYITLEEAVEKNIKAILKNHYSIPIED